MFIGLCVSFWVITSTDVQGQHIGIFYGRRFSLHDSLISGILSGTDTYDFKGFAGFDVHQGDRHLDGSQLFNIPLKGRHIGQVEEFRLGQ